jgi:hypothetical protein
MRGDSQLIRRIVFSYVISLVVVGHKLLMWPVGESGSFSASYVS